MAAPHSYHIQLHGYIEKMDSTDKDFRFMATSDLLNDLRKRTFRADTEIEKKVIRKVLNLLTDKCAEVQNLAVNCLAELIKHVRDSNAEHLIETLCKNVIDGKVEYQDISSVALKSVATGLPSNGVHSVALVKKLIPHVLAGIDSLKTDCSTRLELLDILSDTLFRYGSQICDSHEKISNALLKILLNERQALRKRSITCLSFLCASCSPLVFQKVADTLVMQITTNDTALLRNLASCFSGIAKFGNNKIGDYLPNVIPHFLRVYDASEDEELKESILQAFDMFSLRCAYNVEKFFPDIERIAVSGVCHDPNYVDEYGDESEQMDLSADEDDVDDFSDDDDVSWKVRRASAKLLQSLIIARREHILHSVQVYGPVFLGRVKEREENVRIDIFNGYRTLLQQVALVVPNPLSIIAHDDEECITVGSLRFISGSLSKQQVDLLYAVSEQVDGVIKATVRQLRQKSSRTREDIFALLSQLAKTLPGCFTGHFAALLPVVYEVVAGGVTAQLKADAAAFLAICAQTHDDNILCPFLDKIMPIFIACIGDPFFKVASEGLLALHQFVPALASHNNAVITQQVFQAVLPRLKAIDLDQEVKEHAISVAGLFAAKCGAQIASELPMVFEILFDRCRNELTRTHAIRALEMIVRSPLKMNIGEDNIAGVLPSLSEFVRKNKRPLRTATLSFLQALFEVYAHPGLDCPAMAQVFDEVANLIDDDDLIVSQLALKVFTLAAKNYPGILDKHIPKILGQFVKLLKSSLVTGVTLEYALTMLRSIVGLGNFNFEELLDQITAPVYDSVHLPRQSYTAISSATAVVAAVSNDHNKAVHLAKKLSEQLLNQSSTDSIRLFSLLALGELGRRCPSVYEKNGLEVQELLVNTFKSSNEELKSAASCALGGVAVGNLPKYLPLILSSIKGSQTQFSYLQVIKEIIVSEARPNQEASELDSKLDMLWTVLFEHVEHNESTRNIVAECIGKLCAWRPQLLERLKALIGSPSPQIHCVIVAAIKFTILPEKHEIDGYLQQCFADFMSLLSDENLTVRRYTLITLNSAAHNKPLLIRNFLDKLMPAIYAETAVRPELIKEVEMGPFKHQVDDGLDLRKAAYECMFTLLEACLDRININQFITHVENGLKDSHDIRLLCYITLSKLAHLTPSHVLQRLDRICEILKAQFVSKAKNNAVKQEIDKHEELKRVAIRCLLVIQAHVAEASRQPVFIELMNFVRSQEELKNLLASIENDQALMKDVETHRMDID